MEPDALRKFTITEYPLRLTASNGESFDVMSPDMMIVADYEAALLVKRDGVMRAVMISLINIVSVESIAQPTK